ncbi:hypothetical protein C8F01DRAFT_1080425 [Mycena amicta]|nr:hypothetical protein C8F01DRAFT_1080425 [Mycena amicta]
MRACHSLKRSKTERMYDPGQSTDSGLYGALKYMFVQKTWVTCPTSESNLPEKRGCYLNLLGAEPKCEESDGLMLSTPADTFHEEKLVTHQIEGGPKKRLFSARPALSPSDGTLEGLLSATKSGTHGDRGFGAANLHFGGFFINEQREPRKCRSGPRPPSHLFSHTPSAKSDEYVKTAGPRPALLFGRSDTARMVTKDSNPISKAYAWHRVRCRKPKERKNEQKGRGRACSCEATVDARDKLWTRRDRSSWYCQWHR